MRAEEERVGEKEGRGEKKKRGGGEGNKFE